MLIWDIHLSQPALTWDRMVLGEDCAASSADRFCDLSSYASAALLPSSQASIIHIFGADVACGTRSRMSDTDIAVSDPLIVDCKVKDSKALVRSRALPSDAMRGTDIA